MFGLQKRRQHGRRQNWKKNSFKNYKKFTHELHNVHNWTDAWNIINLQLKKLYFIEDNWVQYSFRKSWLLLSIFEQWMLGLFSWLIGIKKDFVFHFKILLSFSKKQSISTVILIDEVFRRNLNWKLNAVQRKLNYFWIKKNFHFQFRPLCKNIMLALKSWFCIFVQVWLEVSYFCFIWDNQLLQLIWHKTPNIFLGGK